MAKRNIFIFSVVMFSIIFYSCDFFSTSTGTKFFGKDFAYSYEERFQDAKDISTLAELTSNQDFINDEKGRIALLNEFGKRKNTEIVSITTQQKEDLMKLFISTAFPISTIAETAGALTSENPTEKEKTAIEKLVNNCKDANTWAIEVLLQDANTLAKVDALTMMMTSVSLVAKIVSIEMKNIDANQTESQENKITAAQKFTEIRDTITNLEVGTTTNDCADTAISAQKICADSKNQLKAVLETILAIGGKSTLVDSDENIVNRSSDAHNLKIADFDLLKFFGVPESEPNSNDGE